jgi:hypothetical protein
MASFQLYTRLYERAAGKMMSFLSPALLTLSLFSCAIQFLFHLKGIYFSAARAFKEKRHSRQRTRERKKPERRGTNVSLARSHLLRAEINRNLDTQAETRRFNNKKSESRFPSRLLSLHSSNITTLLSRNSIKPKFILSQPIGTSGLKLVQTQSPLLCYFVKGCIDACKSQQNQRCSFLTRGGKFNIRLCSFCACKVLRRD